MKTLKTIMMIMLSLASICTSCIKDDNEEETILEFNYYNANYLAFLIKSSVTKVAPHYSDGSWQNKKVNGNDKGHAIVTGNFSKWTTLTGNYTNNFYKYNAVKVDFSEYSDYSTEPIMTGNASIDGTIKYTYFMGNTGTYQGAWTLTGSVKCSRKYKGVAKFAISFSAPLKYTGSLTFNGVSYQVSDKY